MGIERKPSNKVSDYFAELFVAGRFADVGWNVYFPHRDKGFDFIVTKPDGYFDQAGLALVQLPS